MILFVSLILLGFILFFIHYYSSSIPRTKERAYDLLLTYQIGINLGVLGMISFFALTFWPKYTADYIGTSTCIFQQELGNVNLAFSVLGFLCIWFRDGFRVATVIGFSIWIFADGIGHLYEALVNKNYAPGNIGALMMTDLMIPSMLCVLLFTHYVIVQEKSWTTSD